MERRRQLTEIDEAVTPKFILAAPSSVDHVEAQGMDALSQKMHSWSQLWFGPSSGSAPTEEQFLVRVRLQSWLGLCIGRQARTILTSRDEEVSLATSMPLLTAFLGRRATAKLSRRVLSDL
jgi:hypothetical protein